MPKVHASSQYEGPERRAPVLTETDRHAIAAIAVEMWREMAREHVCQFPPKEAQEIREAAHIVMVSKRAAFWCGMTFAGALIVAAAGGFVWVLKAGLMSAVHSGGK